MSHVIRAIVRLQLATNVPLHHQLAGGKLISPTESPRVVLCVDDEEAVLEYEKYLLEQFGYKVFAARSGREALQLAAVLEFDLVILDYHMPGMNGHEVASVMKRLRPDLKVILLSGSDVP